MSPFDSSLSPRDFANRLQSQKSFEDLFEGAQARQRMLVRMVRSALSDIDLENQLFDSLPTHADTFSPQNMKEVVIFDAPVKSRERARAKLIARYHSHDSSIDDEQLKASELYDVNRITLTPKLPAYLDLIFEKLAEDCALALGGWIFFSSGYMDKLCAINLDGFAAEVRVRDPYTVEVLRYSTPLYETQRKMTAHSTDDFCPPEFSEVQLQEIQQEYNGHMQRLAALDRSYTTVAEKSLDEFRGEQLSRRFQELVELERSIFLHAMRNASRQWRELWLEQACTYNLRVSPHKRITNKEVDWVRANE